MQILRAQPSDASTLSAIAREAKAHWGYPRAWLDQWRDLLTITPELVAEQETFVAVVDRRLAAFYALEERDRGLFLEHLWVLPEHMRRGLGRKLFQHALERARSLGAARLTIEADLNAESFYRHMGAAVVGKTTSEVDGRRRELPLLVYEL